MLNTATDWGTTTSGGSNITTLNYNNTGTPSPSCGNSFPTSISEPLGLSRSFTWDCNGGVLTSTTDENGQTSSVFYAQSSSYGSPDPNFWRPYASTDQLNNPTTLTYPSNTVTESALLFNGNHSVVDRRIKLDSFGRPILSQMREGPGLSSFDSTETDYDNLGRVSKTYIPFTNATDALCSGTCPGTSTAYDALYRPLTVTDGGGGVTTYTYTKNDVLQVVSPPSTGENNKQRQLEYDGLGRLSSVCEITSGSGNACSQTSAQTGFWTKYTYDLLGNITGVTQNAQAGSGSQQARTYTFDMIGRLTSEQNPETGSSAITYTYDTADATCGSYSSPGDLVEKKDAMGNYSCYHYDALHRVVSLTYPSGTYSSPTTANKCYVYDTATVNGMSMANAKTRIAETYTTSASSCNGSGKIVDEGFSYTARGEVSDVWESTPHSGGYYHVNATYWAHGLLNVLNGGTNPLPGLPAITYGASSGSGLDGKGRITQVTAASGQNPSSSITWNAGNQVTGVTFGSGDGDNYQYDPDTGRMTQYQLKMGSLSITGALTWNANGTLGKLQITDQINSADSQTCNYVHDDLMRLQSVNCGSVWSQTFGFDPFGNLSKSGSASFQPTYTGVGGTGTSPTNQYYQLPGGSAGTSNYYDANGNLTSDMASGSGHTYTWDADGNMISVDGSTVTMIYDAFDRMIEQTRGTTHTEIVYGPGSMKLALMNGPALVNAFVSVPGGGKAVYTSTGLTYYRHADHLGSSRLSTKTTKGARWYQAAYAPYGEDYAGAGDHPDLSFTGQNQDTVAGGWATNLYDFMLREYRTVQGRWTSPDPAGLGVVDPTNPQTWNRYAYVLNDPMGIVDPLGLCGQTGADICVNSQPACAAGTQIVNGVCVKCPNTVGAINIYGTWVCGDPSVLASLPNAGQGSAPNTNCPPGVTCSESSYGGSSSGGGNGNGGGGNAANNGPTPPKPVQPPKPTLKQKFCGVSARVSDFLAGVGLAGLSQGGALGVSAVTGEEIIVGSELLATGPVGWGIAGGTVALAATAEVICD